VLARADPIDPPHICLKIVVSPVRVRVSPSPESPDGCWISLFPAYRARSSKRG
jgi:hypothetical protein